MIIALIYILVAILIFVVFTGVNCGWNWANTDIDDMAGYIYYGLLWPVEVVVGGCIAVIAIIAAIGFEVAHGVCWIAQKVKGR